MKTSFNGRPSMKEYLIENDICTQTSLACHECFNCYKVISRYHCKMVDLLDRSKLTRGMDREKVKPMPGSDIIQNQSNGGYTHNYKLTMWEQGMRVDTLETNDRKEAQKFYSQSYGDNCCVRLVLDDVPMTISAADSVMIDRGMFSGEFARGRRQQMEGVGKHA